jgi:hypothetical protein
MHSELSVPSLQALRRIASLESGCRVVLSGPLDARGMCRSRGTLWHKQAQSRLVSLVLASLGTLASRPASELASLAPSPLGGVPESPIP